MPRYVVRKPALSAQGAINSVRENHPHAKNFKVKVDKKRKVRRGRLYRVSFTL
jgi:hypothetical protein